MRIDIKDAAAGVAWQTKRATLALKAADLAEDGTFTGYGSVFDVVDSGGDVVRPGAFAASLAARKASGDWPRLLHEHNPERPIGVWLDIAEDDYGLRCKGKLCLEVQTAREVYALMKAGHRYGLSIGYEVGNCSYCAAEDCETKFGYTGPMPHLPTGQVRAIESCDLWEISAVTFPMNTHAGINDFKAAAAAADDAAIAALAAAVARRQRAIEALKAR